MLLAQEVVYEFVHGHIDDFFLRQLDAVFQRQSWLEKRSEDPLGELSRTFGLHHRRFNGVA